MGSKLRIAMEVSRVKKWHKVENDDHPNCVRVVTGHRSQTLLSRYRTYGTPL